MSNRTLFLMCLAFLLGSITRYAFADIHEGNDFLKQIWQGLHWAAFVGLLSSGYEMWKKWDPK